MKNNNLVFWVLLLTCLAAGFIAGWTVKECFSGNGGVVYKAGNIIRVHDTIKTKGVEYRIIPGTTYNVDSIVDAVNRAWKDSLKDLYGKGLFEAKFMKDDNLDKREIILESRIPIDPNAEVTLNEELKLPGVYPKRSFGIYAGVGYESKNEFFSLAGVKYYFVDLEHFLISASVEGKYFTISKIWIPSGKVEAEVRF